MKRYLEIDKAGRVRTFKGDFPTLESQLREKREERISQIVPQGKVRRAFWIVLRKAFELVRFEKGVEWLRSWKTSWVVVVDGKEIAHFKDRKKALEFEKEFFIKSGL